jgi:hypothetical protein
MEILVGPPDDLVGGPLLALIIAVPLIALGAVCKRLFGEERAETISKWFGYWFWPLLFGGIIVVLLFILGPTWPLAGGAVALALISWYLWQDDYFQYVLLRKRPKQARGEDRDEDDYELYRR